MNEMIKMALVLGDRTRLEYHTKYVIIVDLIPQKDTLLFITESSIDDEHVDVVNILKCLNYKIKHTRYRRQIPLIGDIIFNPIRSQGSRLNISNYNNNSYLYSGDYHENSLSFNNLKDRYELDITYSGEWMPRSPMRYLR